MTNNSCKSFVCVISLHIYDFKKLVEDSGIEPLTS